MSKFAILETEPINRKAGPPATVMHWLVVYDANGTGMLSAGRNPDNLQWPSEEFFYSDRAKAEKDAQHFRDYNARQVEQTKRCRGPE